MGRILGRVKPGRTGAPGTLVGRREVGGDGGSGMVSAFSPGPRTDPDAGVSQVLGHQPVLTDPQPAWDLLPIPGVADRPLFAGVRTSPAYDSLRDPAPFDGSRTEIRGRAAMVVLGPVELMLPEARPAVPSLRTPPGSDPLGRMCANAAIASGAVGAGGAAGVGGRQVSADLVRAIAAGRIPQQLQPGDWWVNDSGVVETFGSLASGPVA